MMKIAKQRDYRNLIRQCFEEDKALLEKWHLLAGSGLDRCVDSTFMEMRNADVEFSAIYNDTDLLGYFGKEISKDEQFLTGFFVRPKYRRKEYLRQYWDLVKSEFKDNFYCGLFEKNKPAIEFITKNGGVLAGKALAYGESALFFKMEV